MKVLFYLLLLVLTASSSYSQGLSDSEAKSFISALINDSAVMEQYVLNSELQLSKRLGITYIGSKNKFLISNDLEPEVKVNLRTGLLKYEYNVKPLGNSYSLLTLQIPSQNLKKEYYFYKSKLISKPLYFAKDWAKLKSKYFEFHISSPKLINDYSTKRLDSFIDSMLTLLVFNKEEIIKLREEKIHYFLCSDENEIELLTNYKARGLYYLPYDYIISTYNCHYHEILHLLMNYKLQSVNLYTLPLLQEGFAVAFGGRGGQNPEVLFGMAKFLIQNDMLDYKSLLTKNAFSASDASMTYPVSGLFVKFLIQSYGTNKFLELYKKYSTKDTKIDGQNIDILELPADSLWRNYLNSPGLNNSIQVSGINEAEFHSLVVNTDNVTVYENSDTYLFKLKKSIGLKSSEVLPNYESKLFKELYPEIKYQNEKYLIMVNADEASVYNLFSNDLVAKYVKSFTINNDSVIQKDGLFIFTITKRLFDEPIKKYDIVDIGI